MKKLLAIEGMSCGHCAMKLKAALEEVSGVRKVDVDLLEKSALVEGEGLSEAVLRLVVAETGYRVSGIVG